MKNGYLQIYIDSGTFTSNYGLCSLVCVKSFNSDKIHIVLFDKPYAVTKITSLDKKYTFYEVSYLDEFPQDKYVPNPPKLTIDLDAQLLGRWNLTATKLLYTIISLHSDVTLIETITKSTLRIDWGYIDSNGNNFLHKVCIHPKSNKILKAIIQLVNTPEKNLINHENNAGQTPLALLAGHIYKNNSSSTYGDTLKSLLDNGAKILIQDFTNRLSRPIMEKFTIQHVGIEESLAIAFNVQYSKVYTNYSMYALISEPDKIIVDKTKKFTSCSQDFSTIVQKNFNKILNLNCPEILDYIFDPKNSLSKTNKDPSPTGESFLNIAARECTSPLLFEHFIKDITDWNPKNSTENILHICLTQKKYEHFYLLLDKIPSEALNNLLFARNNQNEIPINSMLDIPKTEKCTQLLIGKGCLDPNENNLAHFAILSKKLDFLRVVIKFSEKSTFTHRNKKGFNPLHFAIQESSLDATRLLLENSDESIITSRNNDGYNCLHSAIIRFNIYIFKAILGVAIKCDVVGREKIIDSMTYKDPTTTTTSTTPFLLSIEKECLEATELLLSSGANIEIQDSKHQQYPYYIQNYCRDKDHLRKVLRLTVNLLNCPTLTSECSIEDLKFKESPLLFHFWQYCDLNRLQKICSAFSFRNLVKCNRERNTILHLSFYNDKLTEYLLKFISDSYNDHKNDIITFLDTKNDKGETALSLAVTSPKPTVVQKILDLGASLNIKFSGGDNILHIAIHMKNKEIIQKFLCHPKIGQILCQPNDGNETPVTSLLKSGGKDTVSAITKVEGGIKGPNGESILHLVVQNGDEQTLLELFKLEGFSWSNLTDKNNQTPLHYAVIFSKPYAVKPLVERSYDIFTPDSDGNTPICEATRCKDERVWKEMFQILESKNYSSQFPILLQFSIEMNNFNAVKDILTFKPNLTQDNNNNSIIHLAAKAPEQVAILEYLLQTLSKEKSTYMLQSFNNDQHTPLLYAVLHNNVKGAKTLKEYGSSIVVQFKGNPSFISGMLESQMILCKSDSPNLIYLFGYSMNQGLENMFILTEIPIFKSTNVCKENTVSKVNGLIPITDLPLFLKSSCIVLISYLIEHKHVNAVYRNGITLLHYAARFGTVNIVQYLIEKNYSDILAFDKQGDSILYYALQNSDLNILHEICRSIGKITKYPKPKSLFETPNLKKQRILEVCLELGNVEGFIYLMSNHVSDIFYSNSEGDTLLHHIIQDKNREEFIRPFISELNKKYQKSVSQYINRTDRNTLTSLHLAVFKCSNSIVNLLLQNKADPFIVNKHGQTSLHYAVSRKIPEDTLKLIISLLLNYPELLGKKDQSYRTPIFSCIIENNVPALTLLIEHHIPFLDKDKDNKTIMECSIEKRNPGIWSIIFPKFCVAVESKNIVASTLKNLLQVCIDKNNEDAFTDLLGVKTTTFVEQEWRPIIGLSITGTVNTFFLAQLITHLKTQQRLDLYFYPKSHQFTPPLLFAIQHSKIEAIKLMLQENISLSFTRSDNCLTLYPEYHSTPLVICRQTQGGALLTGYKISTNAMYVLVNLPELGNTKIYEYPKVIELKLLNIPNLTQILKSPCIEPIKSVIHPPSSYKFDLNVGCSLIHLAAKVGSIEVLQYLLDESFKSSKILELDQDRNSVLYYALFNGITNIFEFLCDHLVDKLKDVHVFNRENAAGKRILDICIERKDISSFCILLNPKYKVELDYVDSRGYTLFHKLIILKTSVNFFRKLHERTHLTNEYRHLSSLPVEPSKLTSLHLAISENLHDHIEFMLEHKYDLCVPSKSGSYPLHVAVLNNLEKERINRIIDSTPKGKVTSVLNAQNNEGFTPLILAARNGNSSTVEALLKRESIKIDTVDSFGRNALHHSILLKGEEFNLELLKLFLTYATLVKQKDSKGQTPLHYCVIQDNVEALELVLQKDKDILRESDEKKNLIHFAIDSTSVPVWKRVFEELKCSADPKAIIESKLNDETILLYCIKKNNITAVSDTLTLAPDIGTIDSEGNTPLHHAAECTTRSQILTSLIEYIKGNCSDKLEHLFSILNNHNLAPFHYAIWKNNLPAIDIFIHHETPFVIERNSRLTLCAFNSPLSINLCKSTLSNQLTIGYKVTLGALSPPVWILTQIPEMKREATKGTNVTKIDHFTDLHIRTIIQCPSAEPVIAFLDQNLIEKGRKFENSISLLLYSAMYGTLSVVKALSQTKNLYHIDVYDATILFYALRNKDTEVLTFLLNTVFELSKQKTPFDILNAENKNGQRILEVALDNPGIFSILLNGEFKITLTYTNPKGYTLLQIIMRLKTDSKFLTALLTEIESREPDYLNKYINSFSTNAQTALHLCVCNNLEASLRELLKFSPNITCEDEEGNTPLHLASELNFKPLVTILIEHVKSIQGDYPSFINVVNNDRMTPLHLSIISSNLVIAKELLAAGAELYAPDISGKAVLHHAVLIKEETKREDTIRFLFQQEKEKADPEQKLIQIQDTSNNDSPLHLAIENSNNKTIQLLLKESPDLTLCDKHKKSVLHRAISKGHIEIIESILNYITRSYPKEKSDPLHVLNLQDGDGNTALHLAIDTSKDDILTLLLPLNPLMCLKNTSGETPLHIAVSKKETILKSVLDKIKKHDEKEKKSYFYALDNTGLPPLHSAIVHNHLQSVKALIESGAGLAWKENEQLATLFHDKTELPLSFCILNKNKVAKLWTKLVGLDIFVGYRMVAKNVWVVALLHSLTKTIVYKDTEIEELTDALRDTSVLKSIGKCASIEPIKAAIQKVTIDDQKLNNIAVSNDSHENVRNFLITRNSSTKNLCWMLREGVSKNDSFDSFVQIVKFIPTKRDDPNSEDEVIREVSITLREILSLSLENDTTDALKKLLTLDPLLTHLYGEKNDSTLLHLMVEKNKSSEFLEEYLEKVKLTEEQNPNTEKRIINSKNSNSMTSLNMSIEKEQLNNIQTILNYEPNVSSNDASDNSSLHYAAKTGNLEIAQLITGYISDRNLAFLFDGKNSDGCTPLHLATESGNVKVCELLLEKGVDRYSTDNKSRTILHHAVRIQDKTRRKSMVEFILEKTEDSDKIVKMPDDQSCIPLQCAVAKKQVGVVELLVNFTDTLQHKNKDKQTALHLSCIHECDKIVDLIVERIMTHGERNVIDFKDTNSKTALHLSIDKRNHHALERILTTKPDLELVDASENTYLHNAVEVVDDAFFLRTILRNLSEDSIKTLLTHLNSMGLPPLQYAILKGNFMAAEILVGKGAKLAFQKEGKIRLCGDNDKLGIQVVQYNSQCLVGFKIQENKKSHFVITQLPTLTEDIYVSAGESRGVKPYDKRSIDNVIQQVCECQCSDPFNTLLENGLISAETNFPQIAKYATKVVIEKLFERNKDALYHQEGGSIIESAVSNPNLDAFEFLLDNLPEFQQEDVSSANATDSKDAKISLCVKNSLQKSLKNENTNVLKSLIKKFTKINYLYQNEETLLHLAISQGKSREFLEAIFEKVGKEGTETDIEGISFINKQSQDKKQTALHIYIARKQKENLDLLLNNSADPFLWDSQANTALHYSVRTNELHFVETIYNATQEKAKLLQQTNTDNHSALHLAVKGENPSIVEFLLNTPSPFYPVMAKEPTLLHLAIRIKNKSAQTDIMSQLFKHENAKHENFPMTRLCDDKGYPPLHLATDLRNNNAVTLLLSVDPSVLHKKDTSGHTPLHISLIESTSVTKDKNRDFSIFETILNKILNADSPVQDTIIPPLHAKTPCCPSCNVNEVICTQDNLKRTAMHYAIQHDRLDAFKLLLAIGSCLDITDEDENTLHHESVKYGTDIQFLITVEEELTRRTGGHHLDCFTFETGPF